MKARLSHIVGYKHRFKRRLHKSPPKIWLFIDSVSKEVNTVPDLTLQISGEMRPHTKRSKSRIANQGTKELYDRFNNNQITATFFFVANEK